jgi:DNA-binding transcriptional LysR family regulator
MDRLASMETFVRVVETGSFSGAARQLRVGQPAVSKSVAQLEQYLGVKLLTRSCPSSDNLRLIGLFEKGGSGSSGGGV